MGDQLKRIKTRGYSISKVNFIRQALAGYGGGSAIASEMIQNADDAKASQIAFYFTEQALIVRNNSVFTEKDFDSITEIAKGEKAPETGKIGTWGTGFLSVFHITDTPELRSSGEYIVFDPTSNELPVYQSNIVNSTEFRLPWRTEPTELSQHLEADVWSEEQILSLKNSLINNIYRLILFLRHVNIIEVYESDTDPKLVARVERKSPDKQTNGKFTRWQQKIEYKRAGQQPRTDTWLYYWGQVLIEAWPADITIKDSKLAIAFPLKETDWLHQNVPALLYNFLPTPIETGLPFQLNGAFFPDNNRKSILLDHNTQREKSDWNWQVLGQLGHLFVDAVLDIRDQVSDVRRFYELLPVGTPRRRFLTPVQQPFLDSAEDLPIVFTSLQDWRKPSDVYIGRPGSSLPKLAADFLPVLSTGGTQEFRDFLEQKQNIPTLELRHVLDFLRPELVAGQPLDDAHPMINNRDKLTMLYGELPVIATWFPQHLENFAIGLAEDETLWPFTKLWRANKSTRQLLGETNLRFIDIELQDKFASRLEKLVDEFRGANLVRWFGNQDWPAPPFRLADAPNFIEDETHLAKLLRFIGKDRSRVDTEMLAKLPVFRTANNRLVCADDAIFRCDDAYDRDLLENVDLRFVFPDWGADDDIWSVYHLGGVEILQPRHVIAHLPAMLEQWCDQPLDDVIHLLGQLYNYFIRHRRTLSENDRQILKKLPLCITQQGRLVPAVGGAETLHLSADTSRRSNGQVLVHLDQLELDNLIHSKLLDGGRKFLIDILGLETLSVARLIETVIIPHYSNPRLSDEARQDLLRFISEELRRWSQNQQRALVPDLMERPLIRCNDGQYRRAKEVYFASPTLDTVFVNGYHILHPDYGVEVAEPDDQDQTPYRRSTWYWLFELLGVNETPTPGDLVAAVEAVVTIGPPTEKRLQAVRRIYDLLNREAGKGDFTADSELKELANLAWLPARNDDIDWHKPAQLYQASQADFVGGQAPLLRFPESRTELRDLFGMPSFPTVDIIAKHLLASAQENKKIEQYRRVYEEIGRRWNELSLFLKQRLKREAVIWGDGDKYWPTRHVFLSDYHSGLFGQRRCYLKPPGGDAQEFLQHIGVKDKPDEWRDSIDLLLEIAADYANDDPVDKPDLRLLFRNFDHLGRQLLAGNDELHNTLLRLVEQKLVPDKDGYLYPANRIVVEGRQELLDQFDPDTIPVVPESELNENAYRFLRELGVQRLSQLIQRRPVDTSGSREDIGFSLQLEQLIPAFQRIALTYQEQNDTGNSLDLPEQRLRGVKLRICPKLVVGYQLDNGDGWQLPGHSRPEDALYFSDNKQLNYLYVKQTKSGNFSEIALARELERILFPNSKESPVIEVLLQKPLAEVHGYLDEHGYRHLYQDEIPGDGAEAEQLELTEWDEVAETPASGEIEEETESDLDSDGMNETSDQTDVDQDFLTDEDENEAEPKTQGEFEFDHSQEDNDLAPRRESSKVLGDAPKEPDTSTTLAGDNTEDTEDTPPPFTGIRRPAVPVLPNNYGELQRKFGLKRTTDGIGDDDSVDADNDWRDPAEPEPKDGVRQIRQCRFTLTFTNRYEGFLPLHRGARQMLHGQPAQLNCQTDFEEWQFQLFVNYNDGIIYNQKMLPKFFEAYNIPAGGIVYLELVSHDTVRLFWKPMSSRVENIRCLELLEDGTLEEYEVPAAEFPCEIAEYVLRAEKRLEDPEALFKQALNKRGVFQTICEIFGEVGKELSYDEIFKGVMAVRQVAKATIDYQLYQRPCFVDLGNGRWRFEPERGTEPKRPPRKRQKEETPRTANGNKNAPSPNTPDQDVPHSTEPALDDGTDRQPRSPYQQVLINFRLEVAALEEILHPNGSDPRTQLQLLSQKLMDIGQRLQNDLTVLAKTYVENDDRLSDLWKQVADYPGQQKSQQALGHYLVEQVVNNPQTITQIKTELASTARQLNQTIFFPLLSQVADKTTQAGQIATARDLYLLLQEQGGGNFESKLEQLTQDDDVKVYIELAQNADSVEESWVMWVEAWQKYPGYPPLRQSIQAELVTSIAETKQKIDQALQQQQLLEAKQQYTLLLEHIMPFWQIWQVDSKISLRIWGLARNLFESFIGAAQREDDTIAYEHALQVIRLIPSSVKLTLSADSYLEAVLSVAQHLEAQHGVDNVAAAILLEYGLFWIQYQQWGVNSYTLSGVHEIAARLLENVGFLHRAYSHAHQAHKLESPERDRKTKLSQISYALSQKKKMADEKIEIENWYNQVELASTDTRLNHLIDVEFYTQEAEL